jgi:hypothetical protein
MVRLRNALTIVALAAGAFGCAQGDGSRRSWHDYQHWSPWHCSECDDFPLPSYGPNNSMMPGTYSGMPSGSESSSRMGTPTSSNAPATNNEAAINPPDERPIPPTSPPPDLRDTPPTAPPAANP